MVSMTELSRATDGGSNTHGTNGSDSVNIDGPDNIRGHWRLKIGADNDINQHEFSITNATVNGLDLEGDNVLSVDDTRTAIIAIDHAIDEVSYIGSEQNKLHHVQFDQQHSEYRIVAFKHRRCRFCGGSSRPS